MSSFIYLRIWRISVYTVTTGSGLILQSSLISDCHRYNIRMLKQGNVLNNYIWFLLVNVKHSCRLTFYIAEPSKGLTTAACAFPVCCLIILAACFIIVLWYMGHVVGYALCLAQLRFICKLKNFSPVNH